MKPHLRPCQDDAWKEQLFAYAQKMLEPLEETIVREHLEGCSACRQTAEQFQELDNLLGQWWLATKARGRR